MTKEQVLQVVKKYRGYLALAGDKPEQIDHEVAPTRGEALRHLLFMCDHVEKLVDTDLEKAMRWLGFMQGVFWAQGIFTLGDLRVHNVQPNS